MMMSEEEPPPPSVMARALESPSAPAVPSDASSLKLSFVGASSLSSDAASVAVVMVTASKDEEEKDFSSLSLPKRWTG